MKQKTDMSLKNTFNVLVGRLRQDFPLEMSTVHIIDIQSPTAAAEIREWFDNLPAEDLKALENRLGKSSREITADLIEMQNVALPTSIGGPRLLCLNPNVETVFDNDHMALTYALLHEAGHMIAEDPALWVRSHNEIVNLQSCNISEIAADCFATAYARHLELFDTIDIDQIGKWRAVNAWKEQDLYHYTGAALDAMHVGMDDAYFISLTPAEIKQIALDHSRHCKPRLDDLHNAHDILSSISPSNYSFGTGDNDQEIMEMFIDELVDTCAKLPQSRFTRNIAEKAIRKLCEMELIDPDSETGAKARKTVPDAFKP